MSIAKVAVIILNWNGKDHILNCLNSFENATYPECHIIIVDNSSTDGSQDFIREHYPQHLLICNSENLGFPAGNNIAMQLAVQDDFEYIFLLNNDTTISPDCLSLLVETAEIHREFGLIGPKIVFQSNPEKLWSGGGYLDRKTGRPFQIDYRTGLREQDNGLTDIDWVSGCALLIRKEVVRRIGYLDGDYFFGSEDVDYCVRAKKAGFRIGYLNTAVIYHDKKEENILNPYSSFQNYYTLRNLLILIHKHGSFSLFFLMSFFKTLLKRVIVSLVHFDRRSLYAIYRAFRDFKAKEFGKASVTL